MNGVLISALINVKTIYTPLKKKRKTKRSNAEAGLRLT